MKTKWPYPEPQLPPMVEARDERSGIFFGAGLTWLSIAAIEFLDKPLPLHVMFLAGFGLIAMWAWTLWKRSRP